MTHPYRIALLACVVASFLSLHATTIDFELNGPCTFNQTSPLTNQYQNNGVLFAGPANNEGGAVLDECSNFGINAHSGRDFLAFSNITYAVAPEKISFSAPQAAVSIWAGDGDEPNTFVLSAYDSGDHLLARDIIQNIIGQWQQLSVSANNISYVTLNFLTYDTKTQVHLGAVFDDLSFVTPEPGSLILLGGGITAVIARLRKSL